MAKLTHACPFCGGELLFSQNDDIVKCKYCHKDISVKELSKDLYTSKYQEKLNEAIELRNACDFEQAAIILEDVISKDKENAQAYYQLLLCEYGISFVDEDGNTTREVPILNLVHDESIFDKHYYKTLCEILKDNPETLEYYNQSLTQIDKLRMEAIDLMKEEEPYDVFISYKRQDNGVPTNDSEVARRLYDKFTSWGLKCFLAQKTLHEERFGEAFEPIIYSALMSAKIFILVCASPNKEYLNSPWVKSEWMRFKKRVETSKEKLLLIPVLEGGFKVDRLPTALKKFEALPLNEEFYQITNARFKNIIRVEKRSQFQNVTLDTSIKKLKTTAENISTQSFKGFKETDLDYSEKIEFEVATSDMETNTLKSYAKAYERLSKITETNPHNYNANLAKLKCDLFLPWKSSLMDAELNPYNIDRISQDFYNTIVVAKKEDALELSNIMTELLVKSLSQKPRVFLKILNDKNDFFLSVMSSFNDKEVMLEKIKLFEEPFIDQVDRKLAKRPNCLDDKDIETILLKVFKRFYSNYEEEGARLIIKLYNRVSRRYLSAYLFKFASRLNKVILGIDEYNKEALWSEFIIRHGGDDNSFALADKLTIKHFRTFDLNNIPSLEGNEDNIYYIIVKLISGGAKFNLSSEDNKFTLLLKSALIMVNNPKKIGLAKLIIKTLIEMSGSAKISHEDYLNLLLKSGNRFLIEKDYEEASKYFNEILANDEDNLEARWGLTKCEAKSPTNYSLLFYKGSIGDLSSFKVLLNKYYALKEKEGNALPENVYLKFYTAINNIKNGKQYKRFASVFKERNKELLDADLPEDDSIEQVLANLSSGVYLSESTSKRVRSKRHGRNHSLSARSSHSASLVLANVIPIVYMVIITLGVPIIAFFFEALYAALIVAGIFGLLILVNFILFRDFQFTHFKKQKLFAGVINYLMPILFAVAFVFGYFILNDVFTFEGTDEHGEIAVMSVIGCVLGLIAQVVAMFFRSRIKTYRLLFLTEGGSIVGFLIGMALLRICLINYEVFKDKYFILPLSFMACLVCIVIAAGIPVLISVLIGLNISKEE